MNQGALPDIRIGTDEMTKLKVKNYKLKINIKVGHWSLVIGHSKHSLAGFSLIEMMVVVLVFSFIAIIATQTMIATLRSSKKSESLVVVKQNVDFAQSTIERLLRNAQSVTCISGNPGNRIDYLDENNRTGSFRCITTGTDPYYIASVSASTVRLTSKDVRVTCGSVFTCPPPQPNVPPSILIDLEAVSAAALGSGIEASKVTSSTKILLRTY